MIKIAPSILSADFARLADEIARIEKAGADIIHIDVMDGCFVPNITIGPPVVKSLRSLTHLPFDVHLMIVNPDGYIDAFADAGADIISVHVEADAHLDRTLNMIKARGIKPAVALNPSTPLDSLDWILDNVDMVLLMTVNPGFGGQTYINAMTQKIRALKQMTERMNPGIDIEIDGGIDLANIYEVTEAGANVIVVGTTIFRSHDAAETINALRAGSYKL